MIGWVFVTLGVAFASALVPLVSVEVFVVGLVSTRPDLPWLAVGAAVAVGQTAGKLPYYLAARGSVRLPRFLHDRLHRERPLTPRRQRWHLRTKHVRSWVEGLRERCHRHPAWMNGTYGVSSVFGIPPFMAMTVLAGVVRMRMSTFLGAGLTGRLVRFSALAASPTLFAGWFHHL